MCIWHGYCIQNNDDSVESLEDKCFFWENINCIDTVIGESFLLRQNGIRKGTKREGSVQSLEISFLDMREVYQ